ncbi:MAG: putative ABC transporter permease [Oscillospiraceae bacterium]|nr:putative ABC transporter permease [Oscillospiraceae bacterium]
MSCYFWDFIIYSFLGFLLEVLFSRVTHDKKRDRKCFYLLPLCPVYGLGAVLMVLLCKLVGNRWLLIPGICMIASTAAEYAAGTFYQKILKVSFWDYSKLPLNINGQVCLYFSMAWSVLGLFLIWIVHPLVQKLTSGIPDVFFPPALAVFLLDAGLSAYLLRRFQTTRVLAWYANLPFYKRLKRTSRAYAPADCIKVMKPISK